ncbi:MAG: hypothetical protein ACFFDW_07315 [Candidatus Thorarchaeota archaeon]
MNGKLPSNEKITNMKSVMLCLNCKNEIKSLLEIHDKNVPQGSHLQTLRTIVFTCPNCRAILGVSKLYY